MSKEMMTKDGIVIVSIVNSEVIWKWTILTDIRDYTKYQLKIKEKRPRYAGRIYFARIVSTFWRIISHSLRQGKPLKAGLLVWVVVSASCLVKKRVFLPASMQPVNRRLKLLLLFFLGRSCRIAVFTVVGSRNSIRLHSSSSRIMNSISSIHSAVASYPLQ